MFRIFRYSSRGAVLIEAALSVPFLILISLGAIEGYSILNTYMTVTEVVKEGVLTAAVIQQQTISTDPSHPDTNIDLILKLVGREIPSALLPSHYVTDAAILRNTNHGGYSQCFTGALNATSGRLCGVAIVLGRTRESLTSSTIRLNRGPADTEISIWRNPIQRQVSVTVKAPYQSVTGIFNFVRINVSATGGQL